jgi:mitochondrial fission protein ELM1
VTPERLAAAAAEWAPRLSHLPRPLLGVLIGGSNGRFRLDLATAGLLASQLAALARAGIGVALTPSRRTDQAVRDLLAREIGGAGGYVWDMQGDNPYFGLLGLADALLVSMDSVSMISEAVATGAPVMLARLPGRSRRIGDFIDGLLRADRVRWFDGRLADWKVAPLDDTDMAAAALRQRLGF